MANLFLPMVNQTLFFFFFFFFAFKQEQFATGETLKNVKENICVLNLRLEAKFSEALHPKSRQL